MNALDLFERHPGAAMVYPVVTETLEAMGVEVSEDRLCNAIARQFEEEPNPKYHRGQHSSQGQVAPCCEGVTR